MISAFFVLIAVFVGISSLTAMGLGGQEILRLIAPVGIGVALFFAGFTYFGYWAARRLRQSGVYDDHSQKPDDGQQDDKQESAKR